MTHVGDRQHASWSESESGTNLGIVLAGMGALC